MRTGQGRCLIKSVTAGPCSTSECHRDGSTWAQGGPPQGSCCPVVDSSIVPRACDEVLIFSQARLDGSIGTAFARLQCVGTCIQSACERHDLAGILAVRRARWWTRNLPTVVGASRTQEPDHHGPVSRARPEGQRSSAAQRVGFLLRAQPPSPNGRPPGLGPQAGRRLIPRGVWHMQSGILELMFGDGDGTSWRVSATPSGNRAIEQARFGMPSLIAPWPYCFDMSL